MQRERLLQELASYKPADDIEARMHEQTVSFITREPACFDRTTTEGHCTASAFIVDAQCTATVLVYHRKFGRWVQPGGHADGDGDLRRVALREAREETALISLRPLQAEIYDLYVFNNATLGPDLAHFHFDIRFIFRADLGETPTVSDESHDVAWMPLDQLTTIATDESVLRLARKLQRPVKTAGASYL